MQLAVREIDPDNYTEVYTFNLFHEYTYRDSSAAYVPDSEQHREKLTRGIIERLKSGDQKYHCLAAFLEDRMVAALFLDRYEIDHQPSCHVHGLWVHPDYRKMGLAKKLKEMGETWARQMGSKFMDSNVDVNNSSMIALNDSLGYEVARLNFRKSLN